ncbi:Chitin deacetylase [Psilocybe cubensis]|uniref:Chitin deacetylase n=1 Tax=Psilocybe cubensis TaxID=181762 RepID=A0ACB8GHS3_PSICU|nr:Chitin deacetylase [Psilocybe cubensis]KAH9475005.1 Chitin deacetylase [Psilocybe cubensis]
MVDAHQRRGEPDRSTEKGESSIKDPNKECEPYLYQPIADALASFPPIWGPATILPEDGNALAKWASIKANVPDIPPKGDLQGNTTGLDYPAEDPDCWWTNTKCMTPKAAGLPPDVSIMPEPRTLGYGFDDGPNCSHNAFYDYLQSQDQKAIWTAMFYIGSNVMDWPMETRRAVADGHEICVHSWSHHYMTAFSSEDAFAELYYSECKHVGHLMQAVKIAAGVTPTCWRPPFGDVDDRIRAIANGLGLRTILWEYDSQDWQYGVTPGVTEDMVDNEYQAMINDAKKGKFDKVGTMILAHELDDWTMNEARKFYPLLKEVFDHIVPVAVGYNITQPYVENDIVMPNFAQYVAGIGQNLIKNGTNATSTVNPNAPRTTVSATPSSTAVNNNIKKSAAARAPNLALGGLSNVMASTTSIILGIISAVVLGAMAQQW